MVKKGYVFVILSILSSVVWGASQMAPLPGHADTEEEIRSKEVSYGLPVNPTTTLVYAAGMTAGCTALHFWGD